MASENGVSIFGDEEGFRAFPDPQDVFASQVEKHSEFLLPVATIDVNKLIPGETGVIQLVIPIEPCEGALGEEAPDEFRSWYCDEDWLGYRMVGEKCELMTDFRYFELERFRQQPPEDADYAEELEEHYEAARQAFEGRRDFYRTHGWLPNNPDDADQEEDVEGARKSIVGEFGGISFDGNWSCNGGGIESRFKYYPVAEDDGAEVSEVRRKRAVPRSEDGRDLVFVGSAELYYFLADTNGYLMIFYDPVEQIVLTTLGWT